MKCIITLILITSCISLNAQGNENPTLTKAIKLFDDSQDLDGMLMSAELFKEASDEDPNNWIYNYWTAFVYSQCGRLTEKPLIYYDTAQFYLDRVKKELASLNDKQQSDVYALESLISGLKSGPYWAKGDRDMGMKLSKVENESLSKAMALNMDNPRVYLLTGTGLISDGKRTNNTGYVLAGRKMLEIAREKYMMASQDVIYPNWGHGWINFWLSNAKLPE